MFSHDQYSALRHGAGIVDRSDRGRLVLTGNDRRSYLQGLLTNDILALAPGTGCYAALLTPQGRMLADVRVLETGDSTHLDVPGEVAASFRDHLEQFIFSEDVQVADATADRRQIGVYGPESAAIVSAALPPLNGAPGALGGMDLFANAWHGFGDTRALVVRSDDTGVAGFDVFVDAMAGDELTSALRKAGAVDVNRDTAEVTRIEAGRPAFGIDMDRDTIPLEAGIEDRAISLTKGCYVGQEIIIRVLHRGHGRVARRLIGLAFEASAPIPSPGDRIRAGDRDIGSVTSAALSPVLRHPIALGYVHRDFASPGTPVDVAGQAATVASLPFVSG